MEAIAHYRLVREIGRGAMGTVHLACDRRNGRACALKVARLPADPHHAALYRTLLANETRLTRLLDHPNLVPLLDSGVDGEILYVAMEYVPGACTLERFCAPEALLPVERVVEIGLGCARALDHAHRRGVVHRDVKPGNVLLADDGRVRVTDFGIAVLTDPAVLDTQPLLAAGSPLYMSPEQIREAPASPAGDLFALGALLYELLAGVHPFAAATLAEAVRNILEREPLALAGRRPELPAPLCALVARMLAKAPEGRPASAAAVAGELESVAPTLAAE